MTHLARRASTPVRPAEGTSTGAVRPPTWTRRSSSVRSLGNSPEAAALGTSTPYSTSHRRLAGGSTVQSSGSNVVSDDLTAPSVSSVQYIMELTFTQAAKGVNKEIKVNVDAACQRCDGRGHEPGTKVQHCHNCNGSGMVTPPSSCSPSLSCSHEMDERPVLV